MPDRLHLAAFLPMTPVAFEILLALAGGEQHGYAILIDIEQRTGGAVSLARRIPVSGVEPAARGRPDRGARRASRPPTKTTSAGGYYRLTAAGLQVARAEARRLALQVEASRASASCCPDAAHDRRRVCAPCCSRFRAGSARRYGAAMRQIFRERYAARRRTVGAPGLSLRAMADVAGNAVLERAAARASGCCFQTPTNNSPNASRKRGWRVWPTIRTDVRYAIRTVLADAGFHRADRPGARARDRRQQRDLQRRPWRAAEAACRTADRNAW